jgi:hypothetical protein
LPKLLVRSPNEQAQLGNEVETLKELIIRRPKLQASAHYEKSTNSTLFQRRLDLCTQTLTKYLYSYVANAKFKSYMIATQKFERETWIEISGG